MTADDFEMAFCARRLSEVCGMRSYLGLLVQRWLSKPGFCLQFVDAFYARNCVPAKFRTELSPIFSSGTTFHIRFLQKIQTAQQCTEQCSHDAGHNRTVWIILEATAALLLATSHTVPAGRRQITAALFYITVRNVCFHQRWQSFQGWCAGCINIWKFVETQGLDG